MYLLNETIKNILSNFIPHEKIVYDDHDPPWINSKIKNLIAEKNIAKKCYLKNSSNIQLFRRFQSLQNLLNVTIEKSNKHFCSRISSKLMDPATSPKAYWSILKTFLNNKKVPCIPPIYHNNNYITDFKEKAEIFNNFFAKILANFQLILLKKQITVFLRSLLLKMKIIKNLDPNKAHGHDMIGIRMLKICGESILKPLELVFKSCIESGKFPIEWKKANVVPVHKKNDKQLKENYRPISLLPICGKILEQLIYNKMFEFFIHNELISLSQSGFKPVDSYINQLLCITLDIYQFFDDGLETKAAFLDIGKVFEKV